MRKMFSREYVLFSLRRLYCLLSAYLFRKHPLLPLEVMFEPTYRCNLRCKMCPFLDILLKNKTFDSSRQELFIDEIKKVISLIPRFSLVSLTGGEPFIREDILQIIDTITARNKLTIVTNGTLLSEAIAQHLAKVGSRFFWDKGLFLLVFSIHGTEDVHDDICQVKGSFKRALNGLRYVQEAKKRENKRYPIISLNCVITQWNYHVLTEVFKLAESLKVDFCNFSLCNYSSLASRFDNLPVDFNKVISKDFSFSYIDIRQHFDINVLNEQLFALEKKAQNSRVKLSFLPQGTISKDVIKYYSYKDKGRLDKFSCSAPWGKLLITAYADVTSCPFFFIGNIRENRISEIWNSESQQKFRQELRKGTPSFCEKCCFS